MSKETETVQNKLNTLHDGAHVKISIVEGKPIGIIKATSTYIPIEEFKKAFTEIGKLVEAEKITKLIFDKRKLTVFHQPSMEWYFTEWKEQMWHKGLKIHRKILPNNKVFQQSVKIGREKIKKENPNLKFNEMDIQYKESVQDAIDN